MPLHFFTCIERHAQSQHFQLICMTLLISYQDQVVLSYLIPKGFEKEPRSWNGVKNIKKDIYQIDWEHFVPQFSYQMMLEWLPPTLVEVKMRFNARGKQTLNTRMWPPKLTIVEFRECGLVGTIDLRTLPKNLMQLKLNKNNLGGTVHLTHLPSNLRWINMNNNRITRVVACDLPKSLERATFFKNKNVDVLWLDTLDTRVKVKPFKEEYVPLSYIEEYNL